MKPRILFPLFCVFEFFVLMIALEQQAHAYVDPGSGLLIFQVGGSMIAGACFMLRKKLRAFFHKEQLVKEDTSQGTHANPEEALTGEPDHTR